ncbi:MAG TPA: diguanylate cyclase [Candidatus Baltobacteraceae bacterium]|nr:diguanylate cyclase [Candidatus Baltobacteraceae bacterium]
MKDAIGRAARSRADRDREVVQRTAELLTSSLSLEELFHAICSLLARFVQAPVVFIALSDAEGGRVVFLLENGVAGRLENRRVRPGSATARVLRDGRAILKRRLEDWVEGRSPLNLPGQPQSDDRVSAIFVPLKFGTDIIGVLSVQSEKPDVYNEADVELLQTCALYLSVRIHQAQLETQSARLENIASTDSLTGVANRRWLNQRLSAEWRRAIRRRTGIALMLIDIDFFKPFNDTYGHVAGDAALQQVATALASCLSRSEDAFGRYGGEEFIAILPDTDISGALTIAERMRAAVYDLGIAHGGSLLGRLTISAGVAYEIPSRGSSHQRLVETADTALYDAKRGGRNRIAAENYHSDAPPAYPSKAYRHNLPALRGRTFGRAREVQQVRALLRASRLLTVAGAAGSGKSRHVVETGLREIARYPDGVYYIDCSVISDGRYLSTKIAAILGIRETPLLPSDGAVADFLKSKRTLLILDNCDLIMGACAQYAGALLSDAREIRIIVTCREPLLLSGEVAFMLPPLDTQSAITLFIERAKALGIGGIGSADAASIERICAHLGGLPRAVELAAAQLRKYTLSELEERLPDEASMDIQAAQGFEEWTYGVLSPREQTLLRRLSVFAGGATRIAVEEVCCGGDLAPDDVASVLDSLVAHAIVGVEAADDIERFVLPASIRGFARDRAKDAEEFEAVSVRHARYFLERARTLDESYPTRAWQQHLLEMIPEIDNLRAALIFTVTQGNDVHLGAELSAALIQYWQHVGRMGAGREWIEQLLARGVDLPRHVRADLLYGVSRLDSAHSKHALECALLAAQEYRALGDETRLAAALFEAAACYSGLGEYDAGEPYLREALEISTRLGDIRRMGETLNGMALAEGWRGNTLRSRELLGQSLELFRRLEDDRGVASLLGNLGDLAAVVGDYEHAIALSRQSLAILERLHDPQSTAWQLTNIGSFELKRGNAEAARPALRRALELLREHQDDWLSANCVDSLARLALAQRDWERAYRLTMFADATFRAIGVPRQPPDQLDRERVFREAATHLGTRAEEEQREKSRQMTWNDVIKEVAQI